VRDDGVLLNAHEGEEGHLLHAEDESKDEKRVFKVEKARSRMKSEPAVRYRFSAVEV
jgi:hypothetical protein